MRNNEWPICIGTIRLRAVWSRMYDRDVLHRNNVDVETARTEPHRWHSSEESLQLLDAREHFNGCRGRFLWKRRAYLKCCVEKLWLIDETDWSGAIERRNLLHLPTRNVCECDDRFGEGRDRVVEIGPDSKVQDELSHVPDGSAA